MDPLLQEVFLALDGAGVRYCVIRGHDRLHALGSGDDVDLLVDETQFRRAAALLAALGFVRLRAWGRAPHHFFVAYDQDHDRWLKLDIVTRIAYGRPFHVWQTNLAAGCLARRQRSDQMWIPAPEDEFALLLLHCVVDKGQIPDHWGQRLQALAAVVNRDHLASLLQPYWGDHMAPDEVVALVRAGAWEKLLAARPLVIRHLARRDRVGAWLRRWRDRLARKVQVLVELVQPQHPDVAILAPDGAGKSTLAAALQATFFFPVHVEYMGLYQKGNRRAPSRLPGLGLLKALWTQWYRYGRARLYRARGRLVLFDRYTYDALLKRPSKQEGHLRRLRRWLLARSCPSPALVLVLDAPGQVLFQRKREHSPRRLEQQRRGYLELAVRLPHAAILDAAADADSVRRTATAHIWTAYRRTHSVEHDHVSFSHTYRSASSAN